MKPNQKLIAGAVALLAVVGIIIAAVSIGNPPQTPADDPSVAKNCPITAVKPVVTVAYDGVVGETALDTLRKLCDIATETMSFGDFVTTIAGHAAGTTHYWAFYVNDDFATEGAGTYQNQAGDKIKWELTSLDAAF